MTEPSNNARPTTSGLPPWIVNGNDTVAWERSQGYQHAQQLVFALELAHRASVRLRRFVRDHDCSMKATPRGSRGKRCPHCRRNTEPYCFACGLLDVLRRLYIEDADADLDPWARNPRGVGLGVMAMIVASRSMTAARPSDLARADRIFVRLLERLDRQQRVSPPSATSKGDNTDD